MKPKSYLLTKCISLFLGKGQNSLLRLKNLSFLLRAMFCADNHFFLNFRLDKIGEFEPYKKYYFKHLVRFGCPLNLYSTHVYNNRKHCYEYIIKGHKMMHHNI